MKSALEESSKLTSSALENYLIDDSSRILVSFIFFQLKSG